MGMKYVAVPRLCFADWYRSTPSWVISILAEVILNHPPATLTQMQSTCKLPHVVLARREFYRIMRTGGHSYPQIGRFVQKNHAGVIVALQNDPRWDYAAGKERPPADLET